jgi:hypothetical protein
MRNAKCESSESCGISALHQLLANGYICSPAHESRVPKLARKRRRIYRHLPPRRSTCARLRSQASVFHPERSSKKHTEFQYNIDKPPLLATSHTHNPLSLGLTVLVSLSVVYQPDILPSKPHRLIALSPRRPLTSTLRLPITTWVRVTSIPTETSITPQTPHITNTGEFPFRPAQWQQRS